jgi:hypothetical protein
MSYIYHPSAAIFEDLYYYWSTTVSFFSAGFFGFDVAGAKQW